jgi:hypothetical protein
MKPQNLPPKRMADDRRQKTFLPIRVVFFPKYQTMENFYHSIILRNLILTILHRRQTSIKAG